MDLGYALLGEPDNLGDVPLSEAEDGQEDYFPLRGCQEHQERGSIILRNQSVFDVVHCRSRFLPP